jgi:large subunit ribosomal protein L15
VRPGFEGGQLPLIKRLPKMRGFTNIFRKQFSVVNLDALSALPPDSEVTPRTMMKLGLVKNLKDQIKVLGRGEIEKPLVVRAHRFSGSARQKIEAVGGRAEEIGR